MSTSQIALVVGFIAFIWLLTSFVQGHGGLVALIFLVLVCIMSVWLFVVYKIQHSPHLITHRIGSNIVSQYWVTNPAYLKPVGVRWHPGTNGLESVTIWQTNYHWPVWGIWK